jgi:hypothetical protein
LDRRTELRPGIVEASEPIRHLSSCCNEDVGADHLALGSDRPDPEAHLGHQRERSIEQHRLHPFVQDARAASLLPARVVKAEESVQGIDNLLGALGEDEFGAALFQMPTPASRLLPEV